MDDLGITICLASSSTVDLRRELVISLASLNSLRILQSSLSEILDNGLQLGKVLMHGVAEIQLLKRAFHLSIQHFPLLGGANLVAREAHDLFNGAVDVSKPPQTIAGCLDGHRG